MSKILSSGLHDPPGQPRLLLKVPAHEGDEQWQRGSPLAGDERSLCVFGISPCPLSEKSHYEVETRVRPTSERSHPAPLNWTTTRKAFRASASDWISARISDCLAQVRRNRRDGRPSGGVSVIRNRESMLGKTLAVSGCPKKIMLWASPKKEPLPWSK